MTSYPNRETVDLDGIWQFRFLEGVFLEEVKEEGEELNCVATVPGASRYSRAFHSGRRSQS